MTNSIALVQRAALATALFVPCAAAQGHIQWCASLDAALAEAAERNSVVMIAIVMPGERGSDDTISAYEDRLVVELAKRTSNLLLEVSDGSVPPDEPRVRERYLGVAADAALPVPLHIFVKPGGESGAGEVISSATYRLTAGQLEWMWADALSRVDESFQWEPSEAARAPGTLTFDKATGEGVQPPASKEQVRAAIEALKAGWGGPGGLQGMMDNYRVVLTSDEPDALKFGRQQVKSQNRNMQRTALRVIGEASPPVWYPVPTELLADSDAGIREEAARSLEQLLEPKSKRDLQAQFKKEREPAVRGRILRALAAVGPADDAVISTIEKSLTKDRDETVRAQAAAATIVLEDPVKVGTLLESALQDGDSNVRITALYSIAARRNQSLRPMLEAFAQTEKNVDVTQWIAKATAVLDGGEIGEFESFATKVLGDRQRGDARKEMEAWMERRRGGDDGQGDGGDGAGGRGRAGAGDGGAGGNGAGGNGAGRGGEAGGRGGEAPARGGRRGN